MSLDRQLRLQAGEEVEPEPGREAARPAEALMASAMVGGRSTPSVATVVMSVNIWLLKIGKNNNYYNILCKNQVASQRKNEGVVPTTIAFFEFQ